MKGIIEMFRVRITKTRIVATVTRILGSRIAYRMLDGLISRRSGILSCKRMIPATTAPPKKKNGT